jgi:type VI secretion system protein VasJ
MMRWSALQQEPPSENGQTLIPPPESHRMNFLENLSKQNKHPQLVQQAEQSFRSAALWLDLQRYVATGLGAMGMAYAAAQEAVLIETGLLLKRIPRLPSLAFNDGTPLANAATKAWIEMQVQPLFQGDGGGASGGGGDNSHLAEQYDQARQHLGSGDLSAALDAMREGQDQDASLKDRFLRRLYVATLCVKGGQPAVARPVLERLGEEVDAHALEAWDPALALQVWTNLHRCYTTLAQDAKNETAEHYQQQAQRAFDRLCQLDASHALSIIGA